MVSIITYLFHIITHLFHIKKSIDPLHWAAYKNLHREVKKEIKLAKREHVAE
jgi:hypothetical protein